MSGAVLTDAHCHLDRATWGEAVGEVIDRAHRAGVARLIAVGIGDGTAGAREAVALAAAQPGVWAAVGIHPHDAHRATAADLEDLEALLAAPRVVALGEVGLDYFVDAATAEVQRRLLAGFCRMAARADQPLMLHLREAHDDALEILDRVGLPPRGGMVHCFTGGPEEAAAYLDRGLMLSIPGVVTFKNARALQAAVPLIPDDRLLVETDSPYLAPAPHRGRRNEPALVTLTAARVADLRGQDPATLARLTHANAARFFRLPPPGGLTGPGGLG